MAEKTETIDITPTWIAIGEIYMRFAESGEIQAIRHMREEVRRAFVMATVAVAMSKSGELNDQRFNELYQQEMAKFPPRLVPESIASAAESFERDGHLYVPEEQETVGESQGWIWTRWAKQKGGGQALSGRAFLPSGTSQRGVVLRFAALDCEDEGDEE